MKKQDFYRYIESHIGQYLPDLESVKIEPVYINNGVYIDALLTEQAGNNTSPTIYLEQYYYKVANGAFTMERAVEEIANTYKNLCTTAYKDLVSSFVDFDFVRDKITMKCLNSEKNEDLLQQVPHTEKEDLSFVYNVCLEATEELRENILIRNEYMKLWNITTEELHDLAVENSKRILPVTIENIGIMYIVSNKYQTNGAASIFYSDALAEIAEKEQSDVVVIPSSIHEVLVIPYDESMDMEVLARIVKAGNQEEIAKEETLSDHFYVYQAKSREFKLADTTLEQLKMEQQKRKEEAMKQEPEKSVIISFPRI